MGIRGKSYQNNRGLGWSPRKQKSFAYRIDSIAYKSRAWAVAKSRQSNGGRSVTVQLASKIAKRIHRLQQRKRLDNKYSMCS